MNNKSPRKSTYIYFGIAIIIWSLIASLLLPRIKQYSEKEVTYKTFTQYLDTKKISNVDVQTDQIQFKLKSDKDTLYKTGRIADEELVEKLNASGADYKSDIPSKYAPLISILLQFLLPFLVIFIIMQFVFRSASKKFGGNAMKFGKANAKIYVESKTGKKFTDVAGQEEAKEALTEVVDFLHDPKKYTEIGAILPKGVLLVGPPGTGKTLLAQAVAGEAKVPFFMMSGSEFVELFAGLGASKVRDLFKQALEKAPCIVFIDEIDAIGKKRDTAGFSGNDEREQTLNQLLSEMDGFEGNEGVVILGATNRPEILDPALTRPGRFDRQIPVELPDLQGRIDILKVHAKKIKHEDHIKFKQIALLTAGASGAQLANIINESALRAVKYGRDKVLEEDIVESVEVVIAGQQKKGAVITQKEKQIIAYHEVGHALVAAMQTHSAPVTKITIIPRTSGALGYTMQVDQEEKYLMDRNELINKISTLTGGRAAEEVIFNIQTTGAANDIEQATKIARAIVTRYGMTKEFGMVSLESQQSRYLGDDSRLNASPQKASEIDDKVESIIKEAHEKAKDILIENIDKLHEISKYLIEKETITGDEFMKILDLDHDEKVESDSLTQDVEGVDEEKKVEDTIKRDIDKAEEESENKDSIPLPPSADM